MASKKTYPDFIFESSWEVCNKVGGIYTVLSTHAKSLQERNRDGVMFIGPDFGITDGSNLFFEDFRLWPEWQKQAREDGLGIRVGRWNVPGSPAAVLVDFTPYFSIKNELYGAAWNDYQVDSLHAYGDYDEANMFAYASALVAEHFYHHMLTPKDKVVFQAHEWMTCLAALYLQKHVPEIGTIFTTHATSIGRSIAGNNKPLYEYLWAYNGTQMAQELNMEAKHSIERQTASHVDCFTTVSDVTAHECEELLDKRPDVVLVNGFEPDFVPTETMAPLRRKEAREAIFRVANALTGQSFNEDTLVIATSGRYEWKNKGIDVFLESMYRTLYSQDVKQQVLALIQVPAWMKEPRQDLQERLKRKTVYDTPLADPFITHNLHDMQGDNVVNFLRSHGIRNESGSRVVFIFVPCYLNGEDGIFNKPYYDLLIGDDLAIYPSYYEPWGYTPLEAVAFGVPCITTSLSGFGMWANKVKGADSRIEDGVEVIYRNDYNYNEVADAICSAVSRYAAMTPAKKLAVRKKAAKLSTKAEWKNFIKFYVEAYDIALRNAQNRAGK